MTALLTRADHEIQVAVREELDWTPDVETAAGIAVGVHQGDVTLRGTVATAADRIAAGRAAARVHGVRSVVDDIEVATSVWDVTEDDVADAVRAALQWSSDVPAGIHSDLHKGVVTLTGEVQWNHQRRNAQRAIETVTGVEGVDNRITLARRPSVPDTLERIHHALVRNAIIDANAITVEVDGTTVILRGAVRTWLEKSQASKTAWASPHVTEVDNRIIVQAD
ncbi:MAG: BON domain-containing protein [Pseudolysinimonas sp.]